jgi:hypothetical protein
MGRDRQKSLGNLKEGTLLKIKIIIVVLLALTLPLSLAYCQQNAETRQTLTISGSITRVDVANQMIEMTTDVGQMAFSVPDDAVISNGTESLSLTDIETDHGVTIQYYSPTPGSYVAVSIMYNDGS